jgi:hypothetical protein
MPTSSFDQRYFELSNADPYIQSVARPGQTIVKKMPYEYGVVIGSAATPLAVGATIQAMLITLADSDFILTSLAIGYNLTANSDLKFNRNLTIQIQDTSTGKTFFNVPTVTSLVAGGGGFPFIFPAPRVIRPNTGLLLTAANRDTITNYYQMFVTLGGTRIFYAS